MHRRGYGVGAIKSKNVVEAKFKDKGTEIASAQLAEMTAQMEVFRKNLEDFAMKHKEEIRKNPQFRSQFQQMCSSIGVDPLASSKGFWCKMLGVGDFYYELAVQVVEVCMATSHRTGGLMELDDLKRRLDASRGKNKQEVCNEDILTSIKTLKVLGNGFQAVPLGRGRYLIQSIPGELSMDHTAILSLAEDHGFITFSLVKSKLGWADERTRMAMDFMISEGLAWVDEQNPREISYWFPGMFRDSREG